MGRWKALNELTRLRAGEKWQYLLAKKRRVTRNTTLTMKGCRMGTWAEKNKTDLTGFRLPTSDQRLVCNMQWEIEYRPDWLLVFCACFPCLNALRRDEVIESYGHLRGDGYTFLFLFLPLEVTALTRDFWSFMYELWRISTGFDQYGGKQTWPSRVLRVRILVFLRWEVLLVKIEENKEMVEGWKGVLVEKSWYWSN